MTTVDCSIEPSAAQQELIDHLATQHHLVLVERVTCSDGQQALRLTPARFCERCGGDGFVENPNPAAHTFADCEACGGGGGIPVTLPPTTVLESGIEVVH